MIGMESLGPQVKNNQHPFQIPTKEKKSVIWVKLWIPKWLHSRNGCESIWLKGLNNNIPFDPYAMYQLSTHQDSKLNAA